MCTTIRTKHHGCGHTQYQNTSHCHIVRRLPSSSYSLSDVGEKPNNENPMGRQLSSSHPNGGPRANSQYQLSSRDDHRLLLQSTKWLPDTQPRVPPAMFQCIKNVATRPVDGLCKLCQQQQQQQQTRNSTPGPRTTTPPVVAVAPPQKASPQVQSRKEGKAKLHKKNKKSEASSLVVPNAATTTTTPASLSPSSAAAATPVSGHRTRSTSTATATAGLTANERSPSRSLTPASMLRRVMKRDRAPSETPSLDVDLTRAVRESFQKLSVMYGGSGTPEPGRSRSVSAVSIVLEEDKDDGRARTGMVTPSPGKQGQKTASQDGKGEDK
ncbi:hypothetical protein PG991_012507 [Apiospora marii]|uniref:Uncharacterized protein n=1 Tax=Apiospora marii TaxID=335849 RepID=A0ABR1R9W0_9PEZI